MLDYTKDEFNKECTMTYQELVEYLKQKYGDVKDNYFCTPTCATKNRKITRTKDGLYVHHIGENEYVNLGQTAFAKQVSFDYQLANNLVYCNLFEHLILHMLITDGSDYATMLKTKQLVGIGGLINFMIPEINSFYAQSKAAGNYEVDTLEWRKNVHMCLRNNEDIYDQFLHIFAARIYNASCYIAFSQTEFLNDAELDELLEIMSLDKKKQKIFKQVKEVLSDTVYKKLKELKSPLF